MATVTIEGSITPSTRLPRGEQRTVDRNDPEVEFLISHGFAVVVDEHGEPEPAPLPDPVKAPARNASRDDWAEFLATYTDVVTEDKDRAELLAEYDEWLLTHDLPAAQD